MRTLRAFIWLRWRLLRNSLRSGQRRDRLEQISRGLQFLLPAFIIALSAGSIVGSGVAGFAAGFHLARGGDAEFAMVIMRALLLGAFVLQVVFAAVSPTQSAFAKYTRLLLLPVRRQFLHLIEVISAFADPWLLVVIPGLVLFALGVAVGGRAGVAAVALVAGVLLLAVLATFASFVAFLIGWLLRSRRRAEMFTLVFVIGLSLVSLVPAAMTKNINRDRPRRDSAAARQQARDQPRMSIAEFNASLPRVTLALPSEMYGRAVANAFEGHASHAAAFLFGLLLQGMLLYVASSATHRRMIDAVDSGRGWTKRGATAQLSPRLPGLSLAASAVAMAQLRTAVRTVRGRTLILLPGPMFAVLTVVLQNATSGDDIWITYMARYGYVLFAVCSLFALYALQAFSMNLFAVDRAGLTLQFLAPVSDRDLAFGKVAGCGAILGVSMALALVSSLLASPGGPPALWLAVVAGTYATYLIISPVAVWLSALFPLASDLSKTGSGGNPHPLPMFAGMILTLVAAFPVAALLIAVGTWRAQAGLALAVTLVWLAISAAIALPLINLASRTIAGRRENLALVAQGR